jgi:hypothetical protein
MRAKRVKVQSQSFARRLAGVSILGFGASWKAPDPERVVVRDVITALEDRRALYSQAVWEESSHVAIACGSRSNSSLNLESCGRCSGNSFAAGGKCKRMTADLI